MHDSFGEGSSGMIERKSFSTITEKSRQVRVLESSPSVVSNEKGSEYQEELKDNVFMNFAC